MQQPEEEKSQNSSVIINLSENTESPRTAPANTPRLSPPRTLSRYQKYFNLNQHQVLQRLLLCFTPKMPVHTFINSSPDAYVPFWACITLSLAVFAFGNLSRKVLKNEVDFMLIGSALSFVAGYVLMASAVQ